MKDSEEHTPAAYLDVEWPHGSFARWEGTALSRAGNVIKRGMMLSESI